MRDQFSGFSLLEVLITLTLLSVGSLAYVKLLFTCVHATTEVYQQSMTDVENKKTAEKLLVQGNESK